MSSSLDIFALEHKGMANWNSLQPGKLKDSKGSGKCKRMPNWKSRQINGFSTGDSSSSFCLIHFCQVNHLLGVDRCSNFSDQSCMYSIQFISPWVLIVQVLLSNSYFLYEFDFQIILLGLIFLQCFFLSYH